MTCHLMYVVLLLLFFGFWSGESSVTSLPNSTLVQRIPKPVLFSRPNTRLESAIDGTILLRDGNGTVVWRFRTESPIYSSYLAPAYSFFIDCGADWGLYAHSSLGRMKLPVSVKDYVKTAPHVTEDGSVILGFEGISNYLLQAKTGRSIYIPGWDDSSSLLQSVEQKSASLKLQAKESYFLITRKDYIVKSVDVNSGGILWSLRVSEMDYKFQCLDIELSPEIDHEFDMPFPCESKGIIERPRKHDDFDSFIRNHHGNPMMLSTPDPYSIADEF